MYSNNNNYSNKHSKTWLQQNNENDKHFYLFSLWLNFNGNIKQFSAQYNTELNADTIKKIATKNKWIKRKNDFLNHKQYIIDNANDKMINRTIENALLPLENACNIIIDNLLLSIHNKIENNISIVADGKEVDAIKNIVATFDKIIDIKNKLNADIDKAATLNIEFTYASGFDNYDDNNSKNETQNNLDTNFLDTKNT